MIFAMCLNVAAITICSLGLGNSIYNSSPAMTFIYGGLIAINCYLLQKNWELRGK